MLTLIPHITDTTIKLNTLEIVVSPQHQIILCPAYLDASKVIAEVPGLDYHSLAVKTPNLVTDAHGNKLHIRVYRSARYALGCKLYDTYIRVSYNGVPVMHRRISE